MIHFPCPHCRKSLKARPESAGRRARCTGCGRDVNVPPDYPLAPAGGVLQHDVPPSFLEEEPILARQAFAPTGEYASYRHQRTRDRYRPSLVLTGFRVLLVLLAVGYSGVSWLAAKAVASDPDYVIEEYRTKHLMELGASWVVVVIILGAVFALTEIPRAIGRRR
jgi:hypothetical protein